MLVRRGRSDGRTTDGGPAVPGPGGRAGHGRAGATAPLSAAESATYRALAGRSRQALLSALLRAGRPLDAREAGAAVGLHRNSARVQLDVLCSAGLVRRRQEDRATRGRPRVLYEPAGAAADMLLAARSEATEASYRDLARMLALQLAELADVPDAAIRAGRRWAAALDEHPLPAKRLSAADATAELADVLGRLGFAPEPDLEGSRILLHQCPFAAVAREYRAIICGIHLGMLTATMERLDAPLDVIGLDPFVADDPLLCVVRLASRSERGARGYRPEESP